jgi:hypothetical protein
MGRTPSPFLNAGAGKDLARSTSPLSKTDSGAEAKPAASRVTTSAALRKTAATGGPRKANVLGAKKVTTKLGAKKVTGDLIDFDEAEKKAKEEAERIAKLGYDPDAEDEQATKDTSASAASIISPTPVSPVRSGPSAHSRQKSNAEVERLGMGVARLGFGQVGGPKAASAPKKNAGGFGSVGPVKASEGKLHNALWQRLVSNSSQTTPTTLPATSLAPKKASRRMSTLARAPSTPTPRQRPRRACRASRVPAPSRPTPTLAAPRRRPPRTTATSSRPPRTLSAALASPPATTSRTCPTSWARARRAFREQSARTCVTEVPRYTVCTLIRGKGTKNNKNIRMGRSAYSF